MEKRETFQVLTASFVSALLVAALGLVLSFLNADQTRWLLAYIVMIAMLAAVVGFVLNRFSVQAAEQRFIELRNDCSRLLSDIQAGHVAAILNNSVISDAELDRLERSDATSEVWILAAGNLDYDVPDQPFFETLKYNVDQRGISYTYFIRDSHDVRYNVTRIRSRIERADNIRFVVTTEAEWDHLPIVGIPVTIHNPNGDDDALHIYIATQDETDRGSYWSVFKGWTVGRIIGNTRAVLRQAKTVMSMDEYLASPT